MVFTKHGAIMAATELNSPKVIDMPVCVVRAFAGLHRLVQGNTDLARILAALRPNHGSLKTSGAARRQKSGFATRHRYLRPQSSRILVAMQRQLTAIIERDGDGYVALCPEFDIASQGDSIEHARDNLREALELFFETASPTEVTNRLRGEVFVTSVEVAVG